MEDSMSTTTTAPAASASGLESRLVREGYGPGAWHGPDLNAALNEVPAATAFWRPAPGRHNIAEIAVHHAWCVRNVCAQMSGVQAEPFVVDGEDWFEMNESGPLTWRDIQGLVASHHERLAALVADIEAGRAASPLSETERRDLALGITCHAIYHAGQVQLIKRLHA
jgi:hypothetical protein